MKSFLLNNLPSTFKTCRTLMVGLLQGDKMIVEQLFDFLKEQGLFLYNP